MKARFAELILPEPERKAFLEAVRAQVSPEHFQRIQAMTEAFPQLLALLEERGMSIVRLRRVAFGAPTEKTAMVCPPNVPASPPGSAPRRRRKGHGRCGAGCYTGARRIPVCHPILKPGSACPACQKGKLHRQPKAAPVVRVEAQPPVTAMVFEMEVLRCNLCGKTFTAPTPPEAGTQKYDPSVGVMLGLLRYSGGMPFYRLERWQRELGVPLAAGTQWELVDAVARVIEPVVNQLALIGAQSSTVFQDDTTMRVGELRREIQQEIEPKRTGVFTTGIVADAQDHPIALFFTGRQHAGENLDDLLRQRRADLPPPTQMCDGLSRNALKECKSVLACCLAHGRRGFVDFTEKFAEECRHVLESLREVYHFEAQTKAEGFNPEARLKFHQTHSQPVMEQLHRWMKTQLAEKRVEPNSGLGQAVGYMLRHWEALTLFLRRAGAPLDNNVAERALKMAILHRKNSLSYKTQRGARVGDLFMSLIHTTRLNRVNPFDYLMALVEHSQEVRAHPGQWLPWNYHDRLTTPVAAMDSS